MTYPTPVTPDGLLVQLARRHPEVKYASPLVDADLLNNLPAVTWRPSPWGSSIEDSYQSDLGYVYPLVVYVHAKDYSSAQRLGGEIWATLRGAPSTEPSLSGVRFLSVDVRELPIEHRTFGQAISYYTFSFSVVVTVARV